MLHLRPGILGVGTIGTVPIVSAQSADSGHLAIFVEKCLCVTVGYLSPDLPYPLILPFRETSGLERQEPLVHDSSLDVVLSLRYHWTKG